MGLLIFQRCHYTLQSYGIWTLVKVEQSQCTFFIYACEVQVSNLVGLDVADNVWFLNGFTAVGLTRAQTTTIFSKFTQIQRKLFTSDSNEIRMASEVLLSLKNPVFAGYAYYGSIVILKKFSMALMTVGARLTKKIFSNPEDASAFGAEKVILNDSRVERIRRNHLNDLENIPAFLFLGLLYIFVEPSTSVALWHFRIFTISRILHTIAYQLPLPQPSRALFYTTGLLVCASMAFQILAKIH